ncbi:hypothetical protein LRR81_08735 [Metabacillus sp. GX 13764]|uniref:hypothetical protein n=1 Tax=Metabacillus kandeliae TaxID=2900151 RepID=UPI001E39C6E8|nr:hypothetical protein [Metabacillus kandeliae]MCD7034319.1 hypothetical protein [Metabacillus kandeliae]
MSWSAEEESSLSDLREQGLSTNEIAAELKKLYGREFTYWAIQKKIPRLKKQAHQPQYNETHEIGPDGSHKSDKLLRMTTEQLKDPDYLLQAHGFDTDAWELVSARNNIWNVYSKEDKVQTLYSSKITVKPKQTGTSFKQLLEEIKSVPVYKVKRARMELQRKQLLEVPFFDSHFGISDFEYYRETQDDTIDLITSRHWEEIMFTIGQDMLHTDNFRGQTANGTLIESVNVPNAWRDSKRFYYPMIEEALQHANRVKIVYSKGNHDESAAWYFVQMLKERYPQVIFDDSFEERKIHTFGKVFIGLTHGDKARKNLHNLFPVEFPTQWAQAATREVHMGHLHVEDGKDHFGMMVRTLATRNKTDKWHKDNGFVGAHKRFMLFEYTEDRLKSIHYV